MKIHKEGYRTLIVWFVFAVVLVSALIYIWPQSHEIHVVAMLLCVIILFFFLQFFRSPRPAISVHSNHVLAPADGKVVAIEKVFESEYLNQSCTQISIFMSPMNVHINRMPVGGEVSYYKYHPGAYRVAWHPKSSTENERTTVAVRMDDGAEILFRQIAGFVARRIKCYVKSDQKLHQGEEFGFIKFGSRVDIFLPSDMEVKVNVGVKTRGGKTVLAYVKA